MGASNTREHALVRAALDDICRMAARITKSDIVCIVSGIDETHAAICGAVGTNVEILDGKVVVPTLDRRLLIVCTDLRLTDWFHDHALASLAPFASSLIVVLIENNPSLPPYYLALFNPRTSCQKDTAILATLSELSRIALSLLSQIRSGTQRSSINSSEIVRPNASSGLEESLSPIAHRATILLSSATKKVEKSENVGRQTSETIDDPLLLFLMRSLIKRRSLNTRKSTVFVTLRTWRKSAKDTQIDALKSLKLECSPRAIHGVAIELADAIVELYSGIPFSAVIPIPGGHSGREDSFSFLLAKEIARLLSLPFLSPLVGKVKKGSSHPRESTTLPAYKVQGTVSGPVLLIDDVVSSGVHMEKAIFALKNAGASPLAFAWIGSS
jgi:hypothetical protein